MSHFRGVTLYKLSISAGVRSTEVLPTTQTSDVKPRHGTKALLWGMTWQVEKWYLGPLFRQIFQKNVRKVAKVEIIFLEKKNVSTNLLPVMCMYITEEVVQIVQSGKVFNRLKLDRTDIQMEDDWSLLVSMVTVEEYFGASGEIP